jgi:hypothetical protein
MELALEVTSATYPAAAVQFQCQKPAAQKMPQLREIISDLFNLTISCARQSL